MPHSVNEIVNQYFTFQNLIAILKFGMPIVATFVAGRYTSNNPRKREINQKQLERVYLPLYKILCTRSITSLPKESVLKIAKRMNNILYKNYELAFPQLHQLSNTLLKLLIENKDYLPTLEKIIYQVSLDYEILKKKLGYPHIGFLSIFKRMTTIDKINTLIGYAILIYIFPGTFIVATIIRHNNLEGIFLYFFCFILLLYIGQKTNHRH